MQSQADRLRTLADMRAMAPASAAKAGLRRWLGLGLETHISLPVFAAILLVVIWLVTLQTIDKDRTAAAVAARASSQEMIDTYEAQVARNLGSIDQTLKVLKYAVELNGAAGALPALNRQGLLPSGLVFVVMVVDRDGSIAASNPRMAQMVRTRSILRRSFSPPML